MRKKEIARRYKKLEDYKRLSSGINEIEEDDLREFYKRPFKSYKKEEIKREEFERLCRMQCSESEIASNFGVSQPTLREWVQEVYEQGFIEVKNMLADQGKAYLREKQFEMAMNIPTIAIWLGKQYLNQSEKIEQENSDKVIFVNDIEEDNDNKL